MKGFRRHRAARGLLRLIPGGAALAQAPRPEAAQPRLLTTGHALVAPANQNLRILETSGDAIHNGFVPSLGMQRYAIPGRTPIEVQAVTEPDAAAWPEHAKREFSSSTAPAPADIKARIAALARPEATLIGQCHPGSAKTDKVRL